MVAHRVVYHTDECHPLVERGAYQREHSALTRACHAELPAVPLGQRGNVVDGTNRPGEDALVGRLVEVVEIGGPVFAECPGGKVVVDGLRQRHGNAVYADLQGDTALLGRPDVAGVRPHAGPRHTQQGRVSARLGGYAEHAVDAASPPVVLEAHLVDVHFLGASLGQQAPGGVQRGVAGLGKGVLPKAVEVVGTGGGGQ